MRILLFLLLLVSATGCSNNGKTYTVRGRVEEVTSNGLLVAHEAIPGYMAAMTMPFTAQDTSEIAGVSVGDAVEFGYTIDGENSWISRVERISEEDLELEEGPEYGEAAEGSLYQIASTWVNQEGKKVRLEEFSGKPVLMSMVFTNCTYACPMIVRDMKQIGAGLPEEEREDAQYVLVSLDPERDTPEAMARFARAHGLDDEQWTMLRGRATDVRTLANLLGIRFKEEANGQFAHTNLITLLDEDGVVVHQQRGLGASAETSSRMMAEMLSAD